MRITIKLDQRADPDAFAVLWLDLESRHWSREMHSGVDIPSGGLMRTAPGGTLICDPDSPHPLCALTELDLEDRARLIEGQSGHVSWHCESNLGVRLDRWHVQCIDSESTEAENEVFDE
ncbi:DUF3564 family protein [Caballeronia sordidicola]|uniref:DUF3564 family protein n=1 Tax=Caballeronia sordidicola TaxID=196367 RepID=A0A226WM35_CABSO|nr:DUF3564 family protein [Caballeronia sordidicola]OXC72173.1 hypothetical protein BSU04_43295 [Caballeronia sordidicola]